MTIKQLVDTARHPDRHTVEQLREAMTYWAAKAESAPLGQGGDAQVRATMCLEALRRREVTR
jgi:hypothetical protein